MSIETWTSMNVSVSLLVLSMNYYTIITVLSATIIQLKSFKTLD
jgi:hypothetical protein